MLTKLPPGESVPANVWAALAVVCLIVLILWWIADNDNKK